MTTIRTRQLQQYTQDNSQQYTQGNYNNTHRTAHNNTHKTTTTIHTRQLQQYTQDILKYNTCFARLISPDLINLIAVCQQRNSRTPWICSFVNSRYPLLRPQLPPSAPRGTKLKDLTAHTHVVTVAPVGS